VNIAIMPVGFLGTNCYIVSAESGDCAIIDPGAQPEKITSYLDGKKLKAKYILLTHGHHDHIGGVRKLMEAYPDAKLAIGKGDIEMLQDSKKSLAFDRYDSKEDFLIEREEPLHDGDELKLDDLTIRVMETPGHTIGGVCYVCGEAIFSGDTLFRGDVGRCDLYGGNYKEMLKSLKKLAELDGDYALYPGHGEDSTLEYERKNNMYIAEAMG